MFPLVVDESTFECEPNGFQVPEPDVSPGGQLTTLVPFPDRTRLERYLFHHYVTQVAVIMMPYDHPKNPWVTYFPAAALQLRGSGQYDALYSAMLAQAAFNLGQLGVRRDESHPSMIESALSHYGNAMRTLLSVIGRSDVDIATVMTLMMAEVYSGRSQQWRHHLRGAWDMLVQHDSSGSWPSILASRAITSTRILKTVSDTSSRVVSAEVPGSDGAPTSTGVVATRGSELVGPATPAMTEFYFTIGVPRDVLECISRITMFRNKSPQVKSPGEADDLVESVLSCLRRYRQHGAASHPDWVLYAVVESGEELLHLGDETGDRQLLSYGDKNRTSMGAEVRLQMDAWVRAAYIYLYRSVTDAPPRAVRDHVAGVFSAVSSFLDTYSHGNLSLWPAFMAAVEATRDEDVEAARRWLDWALSFGIGIRAKVKTVVEEVWRRRNEMAAATGMEKDLIVVDWLRVMQELDCDVLLI
ncbi:hypothetical protein AbraIFM66951_005982 [Aspergillus brasiliensis]|uniref:Uncharacterized protein n=1 Tax=Aspergillus brasiliensis TaxID=319629 RepID=A0A9W6DTW7_9EURO|nr:hypothetical protein AbraCBS73388_005012 [Aspergillus brasiliensis]GKZ51526.1 hypothetical protein AbraIFM66951_005982 [Aspergillus brasiliensis]